MRRFAHTGVRFFSSVLCKSLDSLLEAVLLSCVIDCRVVLGLGRTVIVVGWCAQTEIFDCVVTGVVVSVVDAKPLWNTFYIVRLTIDRKMEGVDRKVLFSNEFEVDKVIPTFVQTARVPTFSSEETSFVDIDVSVKYSPWLSHVFLLPRFSLTQINACFLGKEMKVYRADTTTRRKLKRNIKKALKSARNIPLPMKKYDGDPENNNPEFEESSQSDIFLNEFLQRAELWERNQVKLQMSDMSLWFEFEFLDAATLLLEKYEIKNVPIDCSVNWRLSGKTWCFPRHFDCVEQYVVHLYGKKKWTVDGEELVMKSGDVLYIPMGVSHSVKNIETSLILNFQYVPDEKKKENQRLRTEFEKVFPLRVQNIDDGKDFPVSHRVNEPQS